MILVVAFSLVVIALLTDVLMVILWQVKYRSHEQLLTSFPTVDILIAARNEEVNIARCLDSLLALDYPKEKLRIYVGDDASTDSTWQIISAYAGKYTWIHGVQITEQKIVGNGKANVLAQLARQCKGDWIFMTDADIVVPSCWIHTMLGAATNNTALVTGTSLVEGTTWFAKFQRMEWLYATSMLKLVSDLGVPASSMGNNMAIRRAIYEEIGGYESIPFSVTEDLELFKQVKKRYATKNLFSEKVLNKSAAQSDVWELLIQRKRWMRGAFQLPVAMLSILIVQAIFFPSVLFLFILSPVWGIAFWTIKWLMKYIFLSISARKLEEKQPIFDSFVLEWFSVLFSLASLIYYFWPGKIRWKGRTY